LKESASLFLKKGEKNLKTDSFRSFSTIQLS